MAAAAGSQQSTAATITEAAERLTPREQRKPEAVPEQVQSTIGLKDAWQVSENQVPSTRGHDIAACSETAEEQQVHQLLGSTAYADGCDARVGKCVGLTVRAPGTACCPVSHESASCIASLSQPHAEGLHALT